MLFGSLAVAALSWGPTTPDVRWTTEAACVQVERLPDLIADFGPGMPSETIVLGATQFEEDWLVDVEFGDVSRTVQGHDCGVLTEAVALIVAVRVDAVVTSQVVAKRQAEPSPEPLPLELTPPEPIPVVSEPVSTDVSGDAANAQVRELPSSEDVSVKGRMSVGGTMALRAAGDLGTLPRGGATLAISGGVRWGHARVELGALTTLGPDVRRSALGVRGVFRVFSGLARGCWVLDTPSAQIPLCAAIEAGVLQGRARGLSAPNDIDALWLAPGLSTSVGRKRGVVRPAGFLEVAVPMFRHEFLSPDVGTLHQLPVAVIRAGLELRFAWGKGLERERPAS